MFVRIGNTPRDYAWGSTTAISELLGTPASGAPEAELWLGAHPASPSRVLSPTETGGASNLVEWIGADPAKALGAASPGRPDEEPRLPFLLKVLAAAGPLSLQAHPSPEQARAGFARENEAGVPLDSPNRNYKDAFHKPELIYALSERFEALCGFRQPGESAELFRVLAGAADAGGERLAAFGERLAVGATSVAEARRVLRESVEWLLGAAADVGPFVAAVVAAARRALGGGGGARERELGTVLALADAYPGDPGIVLSLLLNRVSLRRGEALYLPAGNIHAYLEGLGVELMAASDNVLRGGLTPKHIDVPELLHVLDFTPLPAPYLAPTPAGFGVQEFRPPVADFALWHVALGADADADADARADANPDGDAGAGSGGQGRIPLPGPAIAICVHGELRLQGARGDVTLRRGDSAYVTPEEQALAITGSGSLFVATPNT